MNKNNMYKLLRRLSKIVCTEMCPHKIIDCPENCEFQQILIKVVEETSN